MAERTRTKDALVIGAGAAGLAAARALSEAGLRLALVVERGIVITSVPYHVGAEEQAEAPA